MVVSLSVFTVSTTDLDVESISNSLEFLLVVSEVGQVNVDGGTECSTEVSGAGGDVTEVLVVGEFSLLLNFSGSACKSTENSTDISTLLHRDNTELIFFVDPSEESLGIVVEDTSAFRPVTVKTTSLEETVTLLEQEVVVNQLLLLLRSHRAKRIISSLKVTLESGQGGSDELLDFVTLFLGDSGTERELGQVSADTDTGALDHLSILFGKGWALQLSVVHIA